MIAEKIIPIAEAGVASRVEVSILATILQKPELFAAAISAGLGEHHFTVSPLRYMMRLALAQFSTRGRVSYESVHAEIVETKTWEKAGGVEFMFKVSNTRPDPYSFADNLFRLFEARDFKEAHESWYDIMRTAFGEEGLSTRERLKRFNEGVNEILHSQSGANLTTFDSSRFNRIIADNLKLSLEGNRKQLQPSGIVSLDAKIGGFKPSRVAMIAARPSHGKTSFSMWLCRKQSALWRKNNEPGQVLYFACEMDEDSMGDRLLSSISGVDSMRIEKGELTELDKINLAGAIQEIEHNLKIAIDTHSSPTSAYMMSTALSLNAIEPVRLVVFDYLEYTGEQHSNKDQRLEKALVGCHELAKRLDCPVLVVSQLNRAIEKRGDDARPQLSDMRYTGAAENIAGLVLMLYHPWTHWSQRGNDSNMARTEEPDMQHYEVWVRKNTHGPLGGIELRFIRETTTFLDPLEEDRKSGSLIAKAPF